MEKFNTYTLEKEEIKNNLLSLKNDILDLKSRGLYVEEDIRKIESSIKTLDDDILKIVLIGAFSDGKTTTIAGLLGEKITNMKIDADESSDEIISYIPKNKDAKYEIVDTPGLFGNKEKEDLNTTVKLSDITKKYVSEAHIILYVVNSINTLKESHKEILEFIFRDLKKLQNTIFIVNKMDDVTDLSSEEEFKYNSEIKKENIIQSLKIFLNITEEERRNLNIECISSSPYKKDIEFWFTEKDKYEKISRITLLRNLIENVLKNKVRDDIIISTNIYAIKDILFKKIDTIRQQINEFSILLEKEEDAYKRIKEDADDIRKNSIIIKKDFTDELMTFEKQLIQKVRASSDIRDLYTFVDEELGIDNEESYYKLKLKIQNISDTYFNQLNTKMNSLVSNVELQLKKTDEMTNALSTKFTKGSIVFLNTLSKTNPNLLRNAILGTRDALKIGIKFKPWEALKLAKGAIKLAGPIAIGIQVVSEIVSWYKQKQAIEKLNKAKEDIANALKELFKNIYNDIKDESRFIEKYCSGLNKINDVLKIKDEYINNILDTKTFIEKWEIEKSKKYKNLFE